MRDLKFIVGLLAMALALGGCIIQPLDSGSEEEATDSTAAGITTQPAAPAAGDKLDGREETDTNPLSDGLRSGKSTVGSAGADPSKPQPDPWDELIRKRSESTTSPAP